MSSFDIPGLKKQALQLFKRFKREFAVGPAAALLNPLGIYRLRGRVVHHDGRPAANIRLAICDHDERSIDDLMGVGYTTEEGVYRLTFTVSEFNLDAYEDESHPELYVLFSQLIDEDLFVCHRVELSCTLMPTGWTEVPDIILPPDVHELTPMAALEPTPGWPRRVQRLHLTEPFVQACLEEVAPLVEQATGWSGLLDGLGIRIARDQRSWRDLLRAPRDGESPADWSAAFFNAEAHSIDLNARSHAPHNLDAFKLVLGHELVHVGQHNAYPDLFRKKSEEFEGLVRWPGPDPSWPEPTSAHEALSQLPGVRLMLEIEGYAEYIEQEVLQRYYTCAAVLGHMAFPERELGRPGLPSLPTDSAAYRCLRKLEGGLGLTAIQGLDPYEFNHIIYHVGTQRYFERAKGDEIVPFHVDLEPALS